MTFMAFLLLCIFLILFFLYFWGLNPHMVTVYLMTEHSVSYPVAFVVIGCIVFGLALGIGAYFYSAMTYRWGRWRRDRQEKKQREINAVYREGVGRLLSGDLKKARMLLQKAMDRDPRNVETYIAMASLYSQEGNPAEGLVMLGKARDLDPKSREVLFKTAALQEEMGNDEEAMESYQELIRLEKDNRKALRNLRDLYIDQERWEEALEIQRKILKTGPGANRMQEEKEKLLFLRYEMAGRSIANDDIDSAKSELKDVIRQMPEFTPARVTLGDAYVAQNRESEAVKTWQEGYLKLGKSVFLERLEDYYLEREDPSSLLGFFRDTVLKRGEDLVLRLFYGKLCLRLEMVDEALEQLQAIESSGLEIPQVHLLLAEAHRRRKRPDEAISEYQKALGITSRLRLNYVCEPCGTKLPEWVSRCPSCGAWGSIALADRKVILEAKPLDIDKMVIHHGER
ncbi:MAG TPA: tetratricopeptide repeat protein [Desulfuromonadales bacterium]|nr:tetratricopeptide repeat protein [Desulfuromonadales bacterium]